MFRCGETAYAARLATIVGSVLLLGLAGPTTAQARDDFSRKGFYAGAQISVGIPTWQDQLDSILVSAGNAAPSSVSPNAGFALLAGARLNERVAAELEFEWIADYEISAGGVTTHASSFVFSANAKLYLATERWQPFLLLGMGAYGINANLPGVTTGIDSVSFAPRFGGGLDYALTRHISLTGDVSYVVGTAKLHRLGFVSIGLGAIYRF